MVDIAKIKVFTKEGVTMSVTIDGADITHACKNSAYNITMGPNGLHEVSGLVFIGQVTVCELEATEASPVQTKNDALKDFN